MNNTTHLWNSQTYQLEKEAVLLARDTADVWSFQTFAKPATQLQQTDPCELACRGNDDPDYCYQMCSESDLDKGPPEDPEDFAAMEMTCNDMCGDDDRKCVEVCNACKVNITDMFSEEMYECMDAGVNTEAEHQHDSDEHRQHDRVAKSDDVAMKEQRSMMVKSDEKQSDEKQTDEQQQRDEYILKMIKEQHHAAVEQRQQHAAVEQQQQHAPVEQQGNTEFDNSANLPR